MLVASQNPPFARTSRFDSELRHHNKIKVIDAATKSNVIEIHKEEKA